jgi:hypothetical protein
MPSQPPSRRVYQPAALVVATHPELMPSLLDLLRASGAA